MFFTQMPKGGDLHHHYSGAIYAEQYLDWIDKQGWCVNKQHLPHRIGPGQGRGRARAPVPPKTRSCLSGAEVVADDTTYRELLQRWSTKDFDNHGAMQPPPDRRFFQTFGYFGPVSNTNFNEGLLTLKKRAIDENVSYIETMFKIGAVRRQTPDFDAQVPGRLAPATPRSTQAMAQLAGRARHATRRSTRTCRRLRGQDRRIARRHRRRQLHDALPVLRAAPAVAVAGVLVDGGRLQGGGAGRPGGRREHRRPGKHAACRCATTACT